MHGHVHERDIAKFVGVVGVSKQRFAKVFADLAFNNVKSGNDFNVADVIATQIDVHQAGHLFIVFGILIVIKALH